ncbi:heavy-metal-associated domain-containing protein [Actinocatenispora sera]|uniref:Metal-binding protein n=1 Tax=Actinocatenispora sera TaxID=390989 RepID=A0A810KTP0_9ACTN|nr:heavy-metal-associated domain-containing protein [Actinocatenispora sera]BCJ26217.1 metal-binding protein [Actinocatenispora sera]
MATQTYTVTGMTCGHCASAVSTELRGLPGVEAVRVDVASGRVEVDANQPLATDAVAAAVDEAGYQLA